MKDTNKKIISLLLAGTLTSSVVPAMVSTVSAQDAITYGQSDIVNQNKIYYMNGVYTVMINNRPIYVYLGNEVENAYLLKTDALYKGELNYENVYVFSKTVKNPNYIKGVTPRNITIYALSGKSRVSGWTKINKDNIRYNEKIATSIELGEFLLKDVDLSYYNYNMLGYAYVDINKDGYANELMYIGNNKINKLMTKEDAIRFAINNYENYYIQSKVIDNPNYIKGKNNKTIKIYAISDKSYVNGWSRIKKSNVPSDAFIASNVEYAEALNHINKNEFSEEYTYTPSTPIIPEKPVYTYNYMKKDAALAYAYANYSEFCILTKTVEKPNTNEVYVLYAFSFTPYVDGWEIIGNKDIHPNSCIFLTMQDAYNFEAELNCGYSRVLK